MIRFKCAGYTDFEFDIERKYKIIDISKLSGHYRDKKDYIEKTVTAKKMTIFKKGSVDDGSILV
jgi:hypothetical protein